MCLVEYLIVNSSALQYKMENFNILTQRGNQKYNWDGYLYTKDVKNKDGSIQFWRCELKNLGCNGRIWTNIIDNSFHSLRKEHTCSTTGNATNVVLQTVATSVKRKATTTMESPANIRTQAIAGIPVAVHGNLPSADHMRRNVQRSRNKAINAPSNPEFREDIIIPQEYSQYEYSPTNFERFLLADSGEIQIDPQRILIFGREYHSTWTFQMKELFMDGTFLLSPPLFSQIFVVLSRKDGGGVYPVLFCLLPNKTAETYTKLLMMIRNLWPQLNPESISVDFELAIHQAIRTVFPEVTINGCLFHLVKNLRKHLAAVQLLARYNSDATFQLQSKMITSLAFVPQDDIIHAITQLENHLPEELEPILEWFTNTYIGRLRNNGTRAIPTFPSEVWCVYQRTLSGTDRTNNFAEACHRKIQLGFGSGISHPSLWNFINKLKSIQKSYDVEYERHVAGHQVTIKRRRYQEADLRILNKVTNYNRNNVIEYLRGISYNYNMD